MKGFHQSDQDLQEKYLDWFFLSKFGKSRNYWWNLTDDEIESLITMQNEHDKKYWENWQKMFKGINGG